LFGIKETTQGVSFWYFHLCIIITPISSSLFLFILA
jgi:hypothetical protein